MREAMSRHRHSNEFALSPRRSALFLFSSASFWLLFCTSLCPAQGDQTKGRILWAGLKDNVDRLRSGEVVLSGTYTIRTSKETRSGPSLIAVMFDIDTNRFRFDRSDPELATVIFHDDDPGLAGQQHKLPKTRGGKYARNAHAVDLWFANDQAAYSLPKGTLAPGVISPFDIRGVGIYDWVTMSKGYAFDDLFAVVSRKEVSRLQSTDTVWHLTVESSVAGDILCKQDFWVDSKRGFSPVRIERRFKNPKSLDGKWGQLESWSELSWDSREGVWVPRSWTIAANDVKGQELKRYDFSFTWKSVNTAIPDHVFQKEHFGLAKGVFLIDKTLERPILTGVVGSDRLVPIDFGGPKGTVWSWRVVMSITLVLLVLAGALLVIKRGIIG